MPNRHRAAVLSVGLLMFTATAPTASADIISDTYGVGAGGFELGDYTASHFQPGEEWMRLSAGATNITGWTVDGPGDVDWYRASFVHGGLAAMDIQGTSTGSVTCVLPTISGVEYEVSLWALGYGAQSLGVAFGPQTRLIDVPSGFDFENSVWVQITARFTATSTSTALTLSTLEVFGFGPLVDDVTVTEVPSPTAAFAVLAMVGLSATARRRVVD